MVSSLRRSDALNLTEFSTPSAHGKECGTHTENVIEISGDAARLLAFTDPSIPDCLHQDVSRGQSGMRDWPRGLGYPSCGTDCGHRLSPFSLKIMGKEKQRKFCSSRIWGGRRSRKRYQYQSKSILSSITIKVSMSYRRLCDNMCWTFLKVLWRKPCVNSDHTLVSPKVNHDAGNLLRVCDAFSAYEILPLAYDNY